MYKIKHPYNDHTISLQFTFCFIQMSSRYLFTFRLSRINIYLYEGNNNSSISYKPSIIEKLSWFSKKNSKALFIVKLRSCHIHVSPIVPYLINVCFLYYQLATSSYLNNVLVRRFSIPSIPLHQILDVFGTSSIKYIGSSIRLFLLLWFLMDFLGLILLIRLSFSSNIFLVSHPSASNHLYF